jgi:hypothetical protein
VLHAISPVSHRIDRGRGTKYRPQNDAYKQLGDITQVEVTAAPDALHLPWHRALYPGRAYLVNTLRRRAEYPEQLKLLAHMEV